ncbi:hypothetical protein ACHAXA_001561 [Cyclostephanos tholiformis]|uniref:Methylmalonic aciduria and homocystinuria type D protein n=1 Tax=Cyclostephanos tholiformis TaxID=382380 RepID=A0ABD3RRL3_9STRA
MMTNNQASETSPSSLLPPRLVRLTASTEDDLECSLHYLPKPLMREFGHVFNDQYLKFVDQAGDSPLRLLAIPTNQRAREDLVAVGDHIEREKDRLLNVFIAFGKYLCEQLRAMGYWADYIDPCSGLPMISLNCNKVYSEVDGMECLLNYKAYNAGFCKILTHPRWGSAVYPATIFAHAPSDIVKSLIESLPSGENA